MGRFLWVARREHERGDRACVSAWHTHTNDILESVLSSERQFDCTDVDLKPRVCVYATCAGQRQILLSMGRCLLFCFRIFARLLFTFLNRASGSCEDSEGTKVTKDAKAEYDSSIYAATPALISWTSARDRMGPAHHPPPPAIPWSDAQAPAWSRTGR